MCLCLKHINNFNYNLIKIKKYKQIKNCSFAKTLIKKLEINVENNFFFNCCQNNFIQKEMCNNNVELVILVLPTINSK